MSRYAKLLDKILNEKDVTFDEARKVLMSLGYTENIPSGGSSHVTFRKSGKEKITLVATQKPLKKYLVRLIKEAING